MNSIFGEPLKLCSDCYLTRHRCFPHIINLVVQDILRFIPCIPEWFSTTDSKLYEAVKSDPVKRCRELVGLLRLTSTRRDEYRRILNKAIKDGDFTGPALELIRDMEVRWSSTYNMISRFLEMSEVYFHCSLVIPTHTRIGR
jgi:hypothetical protein